MSLPATTHHEERQFSFNGFNYQAQLWGDAGQQPVIALHGWLDNSASFAVLAPQLSNMQVLAIDLAGHGLSDHRDGLSDYPIWSEVAAIYAIADQMGWQRFALLGHSRGAMMSLIMAGVYPQRVSHLIMVDAFLPPIIEPHTAAQRMVDSIEEIQRRLSRKLSLYQTYDDAIVARCCSRFAAVTEKTAKLLATRGLRKVGEKYHWHADGKLWALSNVALSLEQIEAFIAKITAPSLLCLGKQGLMSTLKADDPYHQVSKPLLARLQTTVKTFDDGHFLHMEKSSSELANDVQLFLSSPSCV